MKKQMKLLSVFATITLISGCCKEQSSFNKLEGDWLLKEVIINGASYFPPASEQSIYQFSDCNTTKEDYCKATLKQTGNPDINFEIAISCDAKKMFARIPGSFGEDTLTIDKMTKTDFWYSNESSGVEQTFKYKRM